ncbi:HIT domain-containing protein [Candidatus Poribacteria bacterium]|nr:HIT domain-containing protein [Candidatus Poribacteria bacterium]
MENNGRKYLLAPWRSKYIKSLSNPCDKSCIFCNAIQSKDAPILKRGEKSFVIMNLYPYNSGHIMVVPNRHIGEIQELTKKEVNEIMYLTQTSVSILKKIISPNGFNIGINMGKSAGAGYGDHIHQHIVPRWIGDENYMSVVGNIKIVSVDIKEMYEKLKIEFKKY